VSKSMSLSARILRYNGDGENAGKIVAIVIIEFITNATRPASR